MGRVTKRRCTKRIHKRLKCKYNLDRHLLSRNEDRRGIDMIPAFGDTAFWVSMRYVYWKLETATEVWHRLSIRC